MVPAGMRNLYALVESSVMYHPPMLAALVEGLCNSMKSSSGGSECVSSSEMTTGANAMGAGSEPPGEPVGGPLGRHCNLVFQASGSAFSSDTTREKPSPSVTGYQLLL